jgi:hypothetical protein
MGAALARRAETLAAEAASCLRPFDPRDVQECYRLGCSCCIAKSLSFEGLAEALRRFGLFIRIVLVSPIE